MTIRRRWAIAGLVLAMAMLATACSDVNNDDNSGDSGATGATTGATGGVPDNSDVTIKLAVNAWVGAEANANVAANLLRDQLGYTVELVEDRRVRAVPGAGLRRPGRDARGVAVRCTPKDYKKYIQADAGVVDAGPLGVIGQIGWFIPTYMVEADPEPRDVGGPEGQGRRMFATSETGSSGQLVDADPSFGSYDQQIADNLGLDFKVVYAGSEAAELTALDAAYSKQDPFLFYFWTPHWAQAKYDLTLVELPEITPACEDAAANDVREVRVRVPAGPAVQGVQRGPADEGARRVRVPEGDELHERRSERRSRSTISDGTTRPRRRRTGSTRTPTIVAAVGRRGARRAGRRPERRIERSETTSGAALRAAPDVSWEA